MVLLSPREPLLVNIFGPHNQSVDDESWAMDNLRVSIDTKRIDVAEPGTLALLGLGLAGVGEMRRRKTV